MLKQKLADLESQLTSINKQIAQLNERQFCLEDHIKFTKTEIDSCKHDWEVSQDINFTCYKDDTKFYEPDNYKYYVNWSNGFYQSWTRHCKLCGECQTTTRYTTKKIPQWT